MQRLRKLSGFSAIEIIIVIAVIAVIGFLGFTFYTNYTNKNMDESSPATTESQEAPAITTEDDLDKATAVMDETQLDDNADDLSELDSAMAEL